MKYIVINGSEIHIFGRHLNHRSVAMKLAPVEHITSAGFVGRRDDGKLVCFGHSSSLDLGSRPYDTVLLRASLCVGSRDKKESGR